MSVAFLKRRGVDNTALGVGAGFALIASPTFNATKFAKSFYKDAGFTRLMSLRGCDNRYGYKLVNRGRRWVRNIKINYTNN